MPCGNLHKEIHEEKKIKLEKVVVYETCEHVRLKNNLCEKLEKNIPSLITFFSPSGVISALPHIPETLYPNLKVCLHLCKLILWLKVYISYYLVYLIAVYRVWTGYS